MPLDTIIPSEFWAALASRYTVQRPLGRGGMATVHLAEDRKHERLVAIKVLRAELASAVGQERFLREIRITAGLDHPHIVPLLDSGSELGLLYFVMPYVEGESLRERIGRERQLPVAEALRIAHEVADALEHAHGRGIVHRDVKPENILLAGTHARVADFGVARALAASAGERLTLDGMAVGTPAYMSPEQMFGGSGDHRVDVYALGCLLYEMLVGAPPYPDETVTVTAMRPQHEVRIPSARERRRDVPRALDDAIRRALAPSSAERFPSAAAFAQALEVAPAVPRRRWVVAAGVAAVVVGGAVAVTVQRPGDRSAARIAVVPREAPGGDSGYFVEGVAEALGMELMQLRGLTVVAHESARRLEGEDPRQAADRLGVGHLVLVNARRGDDAIHVTARLVDDNGDQVWAGTYDRAPSVKDLVAVQRDVARHVAAELGGVLAPLPVPPAGPAPTADFGAYDLLMRGRFFWTRRGAANLRLAAADFERAIALDSTFARAYVALAQTYLLFPVYRVDGTPAAAALARAEKLARTALALDSTQGEAHAALGVAHELLAHDWPAARRALVRAVALAPGSATAHQWYGEHLLVAREREAALAALRRAYDLDPLSPAVSNALAIGLYVTGDDSAAIEQARHTLAVDASFAHANLLLGALFLRRRQLDSVAASLTRLALPAAAVDALAGALSGQRPNRGALAAVTELEPEMEVAMSAALYAALGANDKALDVMARALRTPGADLTVVFAPLPVFAQLMTTRRYLGMLESLGVRLTPRPHPLAPSPLRGEGERQPRHHLARASLERVHGRRVRQVARDPDLDARLAAER